MSADLKKIEILHGKIQTDLHVKVYVVIFKDYQSEQTGDQIMKIATDTISEQNLGKVLSHRGFLQWIKSQRNL